MEVGDKIKLARKAKKISQDELAEKLGINRVSVSNWEKGKNHPTYDKLVKMSDILGVELLSKETSVKHIPIIGTASCGGTDINHLQETNKTAPYNGDFYTMKLYCVIASGDSMAPEIEDGDEVICDPMPVPRSGDMVHYKIGNESAIKILWEDEEANIIQFIPYNSSNTFKTTTIRKDDDIYNDLTISKVVAVNKLKFNNRAARLRQIGRG